MDTQDGEETNVPTEETPQEEQTIPTLEEIQEQVAQLTKQLEEKDKGLKSAHSRITEKDKQLKQQQDLDSRIGTIEEYIKILATAQNVNANDYDEEKKVDVNKQFEELKRKQQGESMQRALRETINGIQNRVNELGLTEKDEDYWTIYEWAMSGTEAGLKKADLRLSKLEGVKNVDKEEPKEDPKDREIASLKAKIAKFEKTMKGELDSETGLPSGGTKVYTRKQIANMSPEKYAEEREGIMAAMLAGNIQE